MTTVAKSSSTLHRSSSSSFFTINNNSNGTTIPQQQSGMGVNNNSCSLGGSGASKVKVLVRVRPFLPHETKTRCLKLEAGNSVETAKETERDGFFVELKNLAIKSYETHRY
jgi:hypothetical protein